MNDNAELFDVEEVTEEKEALLQHSSPVGGSLDTEDVEE